jgi:hypothetical protein
MLAEGKMKVLPLEDREAMNAAEPDTVTAEFTEADNARREDAMICRIVSGGWPVNIVMLGGAYDLRDGLRRLQCDGWCVVTVHVKGYRRRLSGNRDFCMCLLRRSILAENERRAILFPQREESGIYRNFEYPEPREGEAFSKAELVNYVGASFKVIKFRRSRLRLAMVVNGAGECPEFAKTAPPPKSSGWRLVTMNITLRRCS